MKILQERILKETKIVGEDIIKVDMFLNHQLDVSLLAQMGREFYLTYGSEGITRILTVEASGIALACLTAINFKVPVVYAKKGRVRTQEGNTYSGQIFSYTRNENTYIAVSKDFLLPQDRILIIDDFLASGNAIFGLKDLVDQAGATLVGVGVAVEKGFQGGGQKLKDLGIPVRSLAVIKSLENKRIIFAD